MKKFLFSVAAIVLTMSLALTACSKPATDSDVSGNGSSTDVTSAEQSANSSDNGSISTDSAQSADKSESSTVGTLSSEDGEQSADTSASEETSEVVAVVTPSKPDDTSADVPDTGSSAADVSVTPSPIDTPVDDPADVTSEAHVHKYKVTVKYATCTEDGYFLYQCSCGDSYTGNTMAAKGHRYWDKYVYPSEPERTGWISDIESQTATRACWECGESETKALADFFIIKESDIDTICDRILELLNEERAKVGAPALSTAPIAHEMAMVRAEQLTTLFSHKMPDGRDSRFIYTDYQYNPEYPGKAADGTSNCLPFKSSEDIQSGGPAYRQTIEDFAQDVIDFFKMSAGHWADLMNPEYTGVGIGVAWNRYKNISFVDKGGIAILTMDKTYG